MFLITGTKMTGVIIWSNADAENSNRGHKLSDDQYDVLVRELEIIGKY